nr:erythrocyte membrane protein 1, PfEMP1, putative [Plasmodium sp. DRC-Itaito]
MAPAGGTAGGKEEGRIDKTSMKHLFDWIGERVYKNVHGEAADYTNSLKGNLEDARYEETAEGEQTPKEPCNLKHEYHTTAVGGHGKEHPCRGRQTVSFSDLEGAECNKNRIRGNKENENKGDKNEGACAPIRRLSICDYNLKNISDLEHIDKDTLLADVCLAAQYEGESLTHYREQYQKKYDDSSSQLCTMLARSFADIGDIIRGKDLYRGDKEEQTKLQKKLNVVFSKIKENYADLNKLKDEEIREYWWERNRKEVWKAITCGAVGAQYFRHTACSKNYATGNKCRCEGTNDVPTYFDYVPQYLRWFEEWAEEFCRLKKYKLKDVRRNCRGKYGEGEYRYCDRDGFDCERSIYKMRYFVIDKECNTCSVSCRPYESWIAKQQEEFEKQKRKFENQLLVKSRKKRDTRSNEYYKGYDEKFHEILKESEYGNIVKFLELLSEENECTKINDEEEGKIDFNQRDKDEGTFYRSKYCEPCPLCGVEYKDKKWENKIDGTQCSIKSIYDAKDTDTTPINVLFSGEEGHDIVKKLGDFCNEKDDKISQDEEWECYYRDNQDNMCKMKNTVEKDKTHAKMMSFNDFFNFWVGHLLTDTIDWRKKLNNCINSSKLKKCAKECKKDCDCFNKWIKKKKKEWEQVKEQFKKQPDLPDGDYYTTLEGVLEYYYLPIIEKDYDDLKSIEQMKKIMEENKGRGKNTKDDALDILLDHESDDAKKCLQTHKEKCENPCSVARIGEGTGDGDDNLSEDEEEEEETETTQEVVQNKVEACEIVKQLFTGPNSTFNDACTLKYGNKKPRAYWDCRKGGTGSGGDTTTTGRGGLCIPPRRKKMYVKRIEDLGEETSEVDLRTAFIESAAIETYFLWDRYKKIKDMEKKEEKKEKENEATSLFRSIYTGGTDEAKEGEQKQKSPEEELKEGKIPDEFKKQMFYTLGDYRDILYVGSKDNGSGIDEIFKGKDEKETMDKIKGNIDKVFTSNDDDKNNGEKRKSWWESNGSDIWEGMLCALTYKENGDHNTKNSEKAQKIVRIDGANKENLFEKLKGKYQYGSVKLDEENNEGAKVAGVAPTLDDFIQRPTFFRWLQEWGEEFCKKRTRMLKQVKMECRSGTGGHEYCGGDGYDCRKGELKHHQMFAQLDCPSCLKACTNYKKWIYKKFEEFHEQKGTYDKEHKKLTTDMSNADYKKCCEQIRSHTAVDGFLNSLKHCKNSEDNNDPNIKFDFKQTLETFGRSKYCETCPLKGVTCGGAKGCNQKGEKWEEVFDKINGDHGKSSTINVQMMDRRGPFIQKYINNSKESKKLKESNDLFKKSRLFKSVREQKWICKFQDENMDICKLDNFNQEIDLNPYITFKVLLEGWLEDFLDGYYISRRKIEQCTENGGTSCDDESKKNCDCVKGWVEKKREEWNQIKKHFKKEKNDDGDDIKSKVKNFFQQEPYYSAFIQAIKGDKDIKGFENLGSCDNNDCYSNIIEKINHDFITKLLENIDTKTKSCQTQPNEEKANAKCDTLSPQTMDDTLVDVDDDVDVDVDVADVPKICEGVVPRTNADILCDSKKQPRCDDLKIDVRNSTCEPKKNLIGLNAHNRIARTNSNAYISPRVQQLCLEPLKKLADPSQNGDHVTEDKFLKALQKCAYNEAKSLHEYYKGEGSTIIPTKNGTIKDVNIKEHTLEAMKRSYADYGNIIKGDMWWDYEEKETNINKIIKSLAQSDNTSTAISGVSIDDEYAKRLKLWESVRLDVWKAMICGYKDARGYMNRLPNGVDLCALPTIDSVNQFFRWFEEWGENFCIKHEQKLKELEKCRKRICDGTDEKEKQECKSLCENYKEFLKHHETQYKNQKREYEDLRYSFNEFIKKDSLTFLKEKCNSKCSCFIDKSGKYSDEVLKNLPDDVKDQCECKEKKSAPQLHVNDLDKCANDINNNNICNKYKRRRLCAYGKNRNSLEHWYGKDMLIPPRRRHLYLRNIISGRYNKGNNGENNFKNDLLSAADTEAKCLSENYKDKQELLQAIKYSFADIGDIIKGKDIMDERVHKDIRRKLKNILGKTENDDKVSSEWWEKNKKDVWQAMLCGYKEGGGNIERNVCNIPSEENTDQFLRWLSEYGTQYCKEKQHLKSDIQIPCNSHLDKYGIIENRNDVHPNCLPTLKKYEVWTNNRLPDWKRLSNKFDMIKGARNDDIKYLTASQYLIKHCSDCKCSFTDIEQTHKKSKEGGYDIYEDILDKAQIPGFLEDTAYRYKGLRPECPDDTVCIEYGNIRCFGNEHDDDADWNALFVKDKNTTNKGVLLPPRRRELCLRIYAEQIGHLRNDINNFKKFICSSAYAEAKRLKRVYKDDNKLLQAMKYSFSDIGSVVKGDDMKEGTASKYIGKIFNGKQYSGTNRKKWWNENKYHVWESMLCGYKEGGGDISNKEKISEKNEKCRFPDIERVPQFLRWFQEWTTIFCNKRQELYNDVQAQCSRATCNKEDGSVAKKECTDACEKYKSYVLKKGKEYKIQKDKYDKEFKKILNDKSSPEYFDYKCKITCECLSEHHMDKEKKTWKEPYETLDESLKSKCNCQKTEKKVVIPEEAPHKPVPDAMPSPEKSAIPKSDDILIPLSDEPFDPTVLQTTIPFGIALALSSIAFFFLKRNSKPPVDFFSVMEIPKGQYDIPTLKSTNRYIPYRSGKYKGKTYIYVEGDSDSGHYYEDTTDVTTSSESEYEEIDLYVPSAPKYKTLIEVVLEPSGMNTPNSGNTIPNSGNNIPSDIQNDDTPSNKFTDNEWNTLKGEFISNMLSSTQNTEPNILHDNMHNNTHPNTLYFNRPEEKPFIMSIHDRNLYTGEEISYDMTNTNVVDIPVSVENCPYRGIDLINDSLNSGNHDIYDEILKRKENELFGTNHPKNTNIYSVAKHTSDNPLLNQINLFHKWLDRHRNMCEKWKNNNERLAKLKELWDKDNNKHNGENTINKMLNTDVSIQIDIDNNPVENINPLENNNLVDSNNMEEPSKVQIELDVNNHKSVKEKYPIADVWGI